MKIIKIPTAEGALGKNPGTENAPDKIFPKKAIEVAIDKGNYDLTHENIYKTAKQIFSKGNKVIFLGGDHSLTSGAFRAFSEKYKNAAMIYFDAHADCMPGISVCSHEDIISGLINGKKLKPKNLLMLGTRKIYRWEKPFLKKNKIKILKKINEKNLVQLKEFLKKRKKVYVSIDIDVFDAKIAPGTGYPVKNGLKEGEFFRAFDLIMKNGKVRALDLVEVNPIKDRNGKTVKLARKIIWAVIGSVETLKIQAKKVHN